MLVRTSRGRAGDGSDMNLTPEQQAIGRRTFLKALAGTPALAALGGAAACAAPCGAGPCAWASSAWAARAACSCAAAEPGFGERRAMCDINPASLRRADEVLRRSASGRRPATTPTGGRCSRRRTSRRSSSPLRSGRTPRSSSGCLEAGKHVLCEKMMAWDVAGCERMRAAAEQSGPRPRDRLPALLQPHLPGRLRGGRQARAAGRRVPRPPGVASQRQLAARRASLRRPTTIRRRWGYPTFEHLWNWRLYRKYSQGLFAELGSHQINVDELVLRRDAARRCCASGGVYAVQGRPRGPRPRLRDLRVSGRADRDLLVDRVERVRAALRGVLRARRARSSCTTRQKRCCSTRAAPARARRSKCRGGRVARRSPPRRRNRRASARLRAAGRRHDCRRRSVGRARGRDRALLRRRPPRPAGGLRSGARDELRSRLHCRDRSRRDAYENHAVKVPPLRPGRRIDGISAVLLPFTRAGAPDWDGFRRLLHRTWAAGLTPAVNMDTGYVHLLGA